MPFWLILEPFWCHSGPDLAYFAPSGVSFWLVLGEIQFLRQKFVKKHSCIDPGIKFLANFRMQTIFPRPGGGTIAAGNRDSPPGRLAAHRRGVLALEVSALYLSSMHPFPAVGLVFAVFFFSFLRGFHPGSLPFPPVSAVFWSPFGPLLAFRGALFSLCLVLCVFC